MKTITTAMFLLFTLSTNASVFMNSQEAKEASQFLYDICIDTYCGGDFIYERPQITCHEDQTCTLNIQAQGWNEGYPIVDMLKFESAPAAKKEVSGVKLKSVTMERSVVGDEVFMTPELSIECVLDFSKENADVSLEDKIDLTYFKTIEDCIDEAEALIFELQ